MSVRRTCRVPAREKEPLHREMRQRILSPSCFDVKRNVGARRSVCSGALKSERRRPMRNAALMFALPMVMAATSSPATRVLALGTSDASAAHQYVSPWRTPWTYEGPRGSDHWAELDFQYAACSGKQQSP